jgi:hypothetical protein
MEMSSWIAHQVSNATGYGWWGSSGFSSWWGSSGGGGWGGGGGSW